MGERKAGAQRHVRIIERSGELVRPCSLEKGEATVDIRGEGFARHPDTQNLARPFPHEIDAGVAQHAHDRKGMFAGLALGLSRHESSTSPNLKEVIDRFPVPFTSDDFRGRRFQPGLNAGLGKDDTIFATAAGKVRFENHGAKGRVISILPLE